jgi:hypothetical protein
MDQDTADRTPGTPGWARLRMQESCGPEIERFVEGIKSRITLELMYAFAEGYRAAKEEASKG